MTTNPRDLIRRDLEAANKDRHNKFSKNDPKTWGGPTPETAEKLHPNPLLRLVGGERPLLDHGHLVAALQIGKAYTRIVAEVMTKTSNLERVGGKGAGVERDHEIDLQAKYTRWRDELARRMIPLAFIIDVVIDHKPMQDTGICYGLGRARARTALRDALDLWRRV